MQISRQGSPCDRRRQREIAKSMEAQHRPSCRRAEISDQNGTHLGIRNPPHHSLRPTRHFLPPTSQNHEQTPLKLLPNPRRLNERLHHCHHALHDRPIRPRFDPRRSEVHRPRPRHHLPPENGNRLCYFHNRHFSRGLRRDQAQSRRFRTRSRRSPA